MWEAVIVSAARTPIGEACRGAFDNASGAELANHAIGAAVSCAGINPSEIEDVVLGCAVPEGATGNDVACQVALRAWLPVGIPMLWLTATARPSPCARCRD